MEEQHKRILRRNRVHLVKELDLSDLCGVLLKKGVFTQSMINDIKNCETKRDQARKLVKDLETRGSEAFAIFLASLQETGQRDLLGLLQKTLPGVQFQPVKPTQELYPLIHPPHDVNDDKYIEDSVPKKPKTHQAPDDVFKGPETRPRRDSIQPYKMDAKPCGLCLIINNVEFEPKSELNTRRGSNVDCDKLEKRFKSLNFIVEVRTNLKQKQIKSELSALSRKDHLMYDCCVVIILSHGTEVSHNRFPGAVYGVDGLYVSVQEITNYLNGQHCPSLQGKPKIFFIQACGGGEKDTGFEVSPEEAKPSIGRDGDQTDAIPISSSSDSLSTSDEVDARATLPTPSDILVSYSTFPGYVSWRDPAAGSWYVEVLDSILEENAAILDLATMLMMVNNEVSQNSAKGLYKQMPGSFNFLRKHLYFQTSEQWKTTPLH
ncbi:caspase-9 isoform X2 [Oryzias melastigma]|uniref:caspase-9 isoform X2 n=1 Tax=Oryzias melastigma TaxID=30732 RepID=UPI000CF7C1EE|nr:caspase-9 isoform X2 [Oryzias melastigma]